MSAQNKKASKPRADQIAAEIIQTLKKQEVPEQPKNSFLPPNAEQALHRQLMRLNAIKRRYSRDAVKRTRKSARDILKTLDRLQSQLNGAPSALKISLGLVELFPEKAQVKDPGRERKREIRTLLDSLRRECQACLDKLPSDDRIKLECARSAYYLIFFYTKKSPTSSTNSPYRNITGLLYECIAGAPDKDLKRHCEEILKAKKTEQGTFWFKKHSRNSPDS